MEKLQAIEEGILLAIQSLRTPFLNKFFTFFTSIGDTGLIWIVLGIILLIPKKTRRGGIIMLLCLLGGYIINDILVKNLVHRPRPYNSIDQLVILVKPLASYSFPSGHASSSMCCACALTMLYGKKGAWAFIPAVLIAFSRIYCGMHYPSDVIGGMFLGALVGLILSYLFIHKLSLNLALKNE